MLTQNKSSLLNYAVSRLTPDIFLHPVWLRFGKQAGPGSDKIADDLSLAAKNIQGENAGDACQLLLLCAVYQNYAAQYYKAINTTQQAWVLAQHAGLVNETIWSIWGACAIYLHQGDYERASARLVDLKAALSEQNEWILAGFIDILRQDLVHSEPKTNGGHSWLPQDQHSGELLTFTFEWLQQWGCTVESPRMETETISNPISGRQTTYSASIRSFLSFQKWRGRWQSLKLAVQGEIKLQWTARYGQPAKEQDPFGNTEVNLPEAYPSVQSLDHPVKADLRPTKSNTLLPPPMEDPVPFDASALKDKLVLDNGKSAQNRQPKQERTTIPVAVHMLGNFIMTIGDSTVKLPSSRGLLLLKYLLLHHEGNITREVLMDTFWPEAGEGTARNNLNVAVHSLRKSLGGIVAHPVIKFEDGAYGLEPNLQLWLDVEEFDNCVKNGQRLEARNQLSAAIEEYESAISLYQGDLLEQNPYDEWTVLDRERLRIAYLDTLDRLSQIYFKEVRYSACRTACQLILIKDPCREDAHCLLMRCYSRQRQTHLALYQYQVCVEALRGELQVEPAPETTQLYHSIRRREPV